MRQNNGLRITTTGVDANFRPIYFATAETWKDYVGGLVYMWQRSDATLSLAERFLQTGGRILLHANGSLTY
ncbi:MAG: hypothetical protein JNN12_01705, partial [Bacteroidetes Order II. Incertae sedis bacterium]|nr:hypothetical protein [Bacteroidetes Order II. bacterium]